jgi:hypothetical protein
MKIFNNHCLMFSRIIVRINKYFKCGSPCIILSRTLYNKKENTNNNSNVTNLKNNFVLTRDYMRQNLKKIFDKETQLSKNEIFLNFENEKYLFKNNFNKSQKKISLNVISKFQLLNFYYTKIYYKIFNFMKVQDYNNTKVITNYFYYKYLYLSYLFNKKIFKILKIFWVFIIFFLIFSLSIFYIFPIGFIFINIK